MTEFFVYEIYDRKGIVRYVGCSKHPKRPEVNRLPGEKVRIVFRSTDLFLCLDQERKAIQSYDKSQLRNYVHTRTEGLTDKEIRLYDNHEIRRRLRQSED